jgi:hypothetical protein
LLLASLETSKLAPYIRTNLSLNSLYLILSLPRFSHFYQFEKLGDDDDTPEYSSSDFMTNDGERLETTVYFKPRPLENLLLVDELASMSPLTDAKVGY